MRKRTPSLPRSALMQNGSAAAIKAMIADLADFAAATGEKVPEAAKKLEEMFSDPFQAADKLAKALGGLTEAQRA